MTANKTTDQPKNKNRPLSWHWFSLYLLIAFASILLMLVLTGGTEGRTIVVDDDGAGEYTTIQDAIAASENGDTVWVCNGLYEENVVVDKSITLTGNGSATTTIAGSGTGALIKIT